MGEEFQFGFPKVIQAYARGASVESSFSRNPPPNRTDANLIFGAPFIALGAVFGSQAIWGYNRSRRLRSSGENFTYGLEKERSQNRTCRRTGHEDATDARHDAGCRNYSCDSRSDHVVGWDHGRPT